MARFKRCPACGVSVKVEHIKRHVDRAHPGQRLDFGLSESEEERVRKARRERRTLRPREKLLYPLVAVVLVVAIVVGAYLAIPRGPTPEGPAPDFILPSTDGGNLRLMDLRGQVVFLDFMDVDCHFCQEETANVLLPLHEAYRNRVVFVSINVGFIGDSEDLVDVAAFKAAYGAGWTYLLDDGTVAPKYGVTGTPTSFILGTDLSIKASFRGITTYENLASALDTALGG